jgi:hypothetical protein
MRFMIGKLLSGVQTAGIVAHTAAPARDAHHKV